MEDMREDQIASTCLIFPFSKVNANAISALVASIDVDPYLSQLKILFPKLNQNPDEIKNRLKKFRKVCLAFSLFSTQLDQVTKQIKDYRNALKDKELLVIAGGPHPMGDPFSMLINGTDIVCTTEGELVIREVMKNFIDGKDLKNVLGIAYLDNNKIVTKNSKPKLINLDDFPPFSIKHNLIRPIEITRGCAWNCRFCQIRSRGLPVRHRSVSQVVKYVKHTVEYFHKRRPDIRFISPNALSYGADDGKTLKLNVVEDLLNQIKKIIGEEGKIYFGSFPSEVRPETITEESVKLLKKYTNVKKIIVGGQSGSNNVLNFSDRGHTVEETERAVKMLIDTGFDVDVDIIFGLPGETEEDVQKTLAHINYLTDIGATIHSHTFMPLVGTPFASKPAGTVSQLYLPVISNLQEDRKLSGFHVKQAKEAKNMAKRKLDNNEYKKNRIK
ncbi:MAG: TIGR04013 family B12-binding domain/radical SAM domain-containing protein [Candidatus Kariarchaeaceae archaeon]